VGVVQEVEAVEKALMPGAEVDQVKME